MDERNTPRGWRAEAEFRADQRVTAAIDVLRKMTAAGLRQHFADGEVMVRDMAPEQRARWDAQMDALNPIADAWIAEDCQVWWAIVLALLEERDEARAQAERALKMRLNAEEWLKDEGLRANQARADLRAIADLLGTTDTTGLPGRLRARLAGQPREDVCRPFRGSVPDRGIILIARGEPMRWWRCAGLEAVCGSCGLRAANDVHDTMQWQGVDGVICGPCLGSDGDVTAVCAACGRVPYDEDGCCDICGADTDANGPIDNDMATAEAETQSEHVITESARRMFEAAIAGELTHDLINGSHSPGTSAARALSMARLFAETEAQERARNAPGARNGGNHD